MNKELYLDGMMGLIVGDALGVPVEFSSREEMKKHPVTDMTGYGTYPVPAGSWSDDSSMALASLSALTHGHLRSKMPWIRLLHFTNRIVRARRNWRILTE